MKSLSSYYHELLNHWYQKAELYHPTALKELRQCPCEMGKEEHERVQDQKKEVTQLGMAEETELQ